MASHQHQYQGHVDDDLRVHEATFHKFLDLVYVGLLHAANCLVALAIGGIEGHWPTAAAIIILATFFAIYSVVKGSHWPMALVLLLALFALGLHV
jgi:hypothetical protein